MLCSWFFDQPSASTLHPSYHVVDSNIQTSKSRSNNSGYCIQQGSFANVEPEKGLSRLEWLSFVLHGAIIAPINVEGWLKDGNKSVVRMFLLFGNMGMPRLTLKQKSRDSHLEMAIVRAIKKGGKAYMEQEDRRFVNVQTFTCREKILHRQLPTRKPLDVKMGKLFWLVPMVHSRNLTLEPITVSSAVGNCWLSQLLNAFRKK